MLDVEVLKKELTNFLNEKLELLTLGKGTITNLPVNYLMEVQKETNFFQIEDNKFCVFNQELPAGEGEVIETFGFKVLYCGVPFTFTVVMRYYYSDWGVEFPNVYLKSIQTLEEMIEEYKEGFAKNPLKAYFALQSN